MRSVGLRRLAVSSYDLLSDSAKKTLEAYSDGINDFVQGVDMFSTKATGKSLPPEFVIFGITKENFKWTPLDSLTIGKLMQF